MWSVAAVALAAVLAGTIGTAAQLGPDELSPMAAASWRSQLGAVGFLVASMLCQQAPWRYRLPIRWVVLGGLGAAVSQLAFFVAADRTGVAVATLVTIGTAPLVAGLMDWMAAGQRPNRHWLGGVALALAGVTLLSGGAVQVVGSGVALAVLAGCGIRWPQWWVGAPWCCSRRHSWRRMVHWGLRRLWPRWCIWGWRQ